jgi:putative lipase involved disintegration of autophagic bodies
MAFPWPPGRVLAAVRGRKFMQDQWLSVEEIVVHLGVNRDTIFS